MAAKTDNEKIRKQVNFYFSDSNLPYDKFLWTLHSQAKDNWVPLSVIANFKRMRMVSDDIDIILNALKEQESAVYEISEDGKNIRRKGEVVEQNHTIRSIHAKGFPLVDADAENPEEKLFELQDKVDDFFNEKSKVLATRLKKDKKAFKGSLYVEFETIDEAKKVADLNELDFEGHKIVLTYRPTYHEIKSEQFKNSPKKNERRVYQFNAFKSLSHNNNNNNKRKNNNNHKDNKRGKFNKREDKKADDMVESEPAEEKHVEEKPAEEKPVEENKA
ncbi:hypothetical protein BY458DRAFT_532583 [Sporodiniella umbellata]|nr:hypothetical protein BY458DRAFT_532583 [Sporodiniella umbellata]